MQIDVRRSGVLGCSSCQQPGGLEAGRQRRQSPREATEHGVTPGCRDGEDRTNPPGQWSSEMGEGARAWRDGWCSRAAQADGPGRGRDTSLPSLLLFQVSLDCVGAKLVNSPNTILKISLQRLPVVQVSHGWEQEKMQDLRARRVEDLKTGRPGSRMDGRPRSRRNGGPGLRKNGGPGNRRDGGPGHWEMPKNPTGFSGGSRFTAQLHWPLSGLLSGILLVLISMGEARSQCQPLPKSSHCHPILPLLQGSSQPILLLPPWGRIWMLCLFLIYAKLKKKYIFFNY